MISHFMVDQGLEFTLESDVHDMVDFVDDCLSDFECGDYGFKVTSGKGVIDTQWILLVRPKELADPDKQQEPLGCIIISKQGDGVHLLVPPPIEFRREFYHTDDVENPTELEVDLFLNFVCQILNGLGDRGLVDLPGLVPVR